MTDYHINVFYSEEDGGYIADIPDLEPARPSETPPKQAPAEVEKAKEAWIVAAKQAGLSIPEPRYRPAIYG